MAKSKKAAKLPVEDYRHDSESRKNIPPAKIAAEGLVPNVPRAKYSYSPRLSPVLRFDQRGGPDKVAELLAAARRRKLTAEESALLESALTRQEPWLEWAGKREAKSFEVDPVALQIHERISAQAILRAASRNDVQRDLFADPQLEYHKAVQFYQHDIDWTNRLILGDSLQVMSSLARREDLAGKVQMVFMDPPYGIKFASNFQPLVGKREVREKTDDLTREPEMVRAYRDTWHLGVHSYLAYLRDRLVVARELLSDSGSIFVQISDENLHRVRTLLDEVFGPQNFAGQISFAKTTGATVVHLAGAMDYLLWYARDVEQLKYRQLFLKKILGMKGASNYGRVELPTGERRYLTREEKAAPASLPKGARVYALDNLTSQSIGRQKGEGCGSADATAGHAALLRSGSSLAA